MPRYALPGIVIQMLLRTPPNKRTYAKRCVKSSLYHSFRQIHWGRPLDNDNILHGFFLQAQAICPKPTSQWEGPKNCKDYFDTTGAIGINHTWFATSFLCNKISFCWHKCTYQSQELALLSWVEFKAFFQKSLGNSKVSVYTTWSCIRQDSQD